LVERVAVTDTGGPEQCRLGHWLGEQVAAGREVDLQEDLEQAVAAVTEKHSACQGSRLLQHWTFIYRNSILFI